MPFDLFLSLNQFLKLRQDDLFSVKNIVNLNIDPASLQISFTNIENIQKIVDLQFENAEGVKPKEAQNDVKQQKKEEEASEVKKVKGEVNYALTENAITVKLHKLQLGVINDSVDAVPILHFIIKADFDSKMFFQFSESLLLLDLKLMYFNPQKSRWEPVIEPTGLKVHLLQNEFINPKFKLDVELDGRYYKHLNLNISTQFLNVLTQGLKSLPKPTLSKEIQHEERDFESVIKVSPYKIQNLTGYKLLITRQFQES